MMYFINSSHAVTVIDGSYGNTTMFVESNPSNDT